MTDPDVRRVLAQQTSWTVRHVPHEHMREGVAQIAQHIQAGPDQSMWIVDAVDDLDLYRLAAATAGRRLLVGASGVARGLTQQLGFVPSEPCWTAVKGPAAIIAGSCSVRTQEQVAAFAEKNPSMKLTPDDILHQPDLADDVVRWSSQQTRAPLVYTTAGRDEVATAQARYGMEVIAERTETILASIAHRLVREVGFRNLIVAGGETSGAVISRLGCSELRIGPSVAPGVPLLRAQGLPGTACAGPLGLVLKSGNFGSVSLFEDALARLGLAQC